MPIKPRFPDNLIKAALIKIDPTGSGPRDLAIARGENAARAWVLASFDLAPPLPPPNERCMEFGISFPGFHGRPTKVEFVRAMASLCDALEAKFKFDPSNGTAQVKTKNLLNCEAYGFYAQLNTLAERFDLWTVLNKAEDETPPEFDLQVHRSTLDAGGCNFCPMRTTTVYEIGSKLRTLKVRMCPGCVKAFREQTKGVR
jgi:hypothetical protein